MLRTIRFTAISRAVSSSLQFHVRTNVTNKQEPIVPCSTADGTGKVVPVATDVSNAHQKPMPPPEVKEIDETVRKAREKVVQARLKLHFCSRCSKEFSNDDPEWLEEESLHGIVKQLEHKYSVRLSSKMYREAVEDSIRYHRHAMKVGKETIIADENKFDTDVKIAEGELAETETKAGIVRNNEQVQEIDEAVLKARRNVVKAQFKLACCDRYLARIGDNYPMRLDKEDVENLVKQLEGDYDVHVSCTMLHKALDDSFPYHRHALKMIEAAIDDNYEEAKAEREIAERELAEAETKAGIVMTKKRGWSPETDEATKESDDDGEEDD